MYRSKTTYDGFLKPAVTSSNHWLSTCRCSSSPPWNASQELETRQPSESTSKHTSVPSASFVARCVFSEPDTNCQRESDGSQMIPSLTGAPRPTARRQK
ncbi:hypothetical protein MUK42_28695 [Musa troglodytarum]|uniref:Uncharacterized protein n=1 Tax=Musa troglodytarum TaxID=320322 RepID=A0A9E7KCY9_9LILI|nr:hypothetical protein MUK42_28695 [Musa troglodytarum]